MLAGLGMVVSLWTVVGDYYGMEREGRRERGGWNVLSGYPISERRGGDWVEKERNTHTLPLWVVFTACLWEHVLFLNSLHPIEGREWGKRDWVRANEEIETKTLKLEKVCVCVFFTSGNQIVRRPPITPVTHSARLTASISLSVCHTRPCCTPGLIHHMLTAQYLS